MSCNNGGSLSWVIMQPISGFSYWFQSAPGDEGGVDIGLYTVGFTGEEGNIIGCGSSKGVELAGGCEGVELAGGCEGVELAGGCEGVELAGGCEGVELAGGCEGVELAGGCEGVELAGGCEGVELAGGCEGVELAGGCEGVELAGGCEGVELAGGCEGVELAGGCEGVELAGGCEGVELAGGCEGTLGSNEGVSELVLDMVLCESTVPLLGGAERTAVIAVVFDVIGEAKEEVEAELEVLDITVAEETHLSGSAHDLLFLFGFSVSKAVRVGQALVVGPSSICSSLPEAFSTSDCISAQCKYVACTGSRNKVES